MQPVVVRIFHAPPIGVGPLAAALADVRLALAEHHARGFRAAGAIDVRIIADADGRPFGARLHDEAARLPSGAGLVVMGSGALPLAGARDLRSFVAAAGAGGSGVDSAGIAAADARGHALTNNRYSGDVVAIPDARRVLADVPDLAADNALPRWLAERADLSVADLRGRRALQADLDGLADLALLVRSPRCPVVLSAAAARHDGILADLRARIAAVETVAADPRAEVVVAGRLSAAGLVRMESATACRVRALVEERGLRAADPRAQAAASEGPRAGTATGVAGTATGGAGTLPPVAYAPSATDDADRQRPPASVLGMVLEHEGPAALGTVLARLGDAAIVDTRVILAHRLGADERAWSSLEDRLASDLGLVASVLDPWLRVLTESAAAAPIPVVLGAHSLVGPGLDLLFGRPGRIAGRRRVPTPNAPSLGIGPA